MKALRIIAPLLLLVCLGAIWYLTVQDSDATVSLSAWWADLLSNSMGLDSETSSFIVRKIAHIAEFLPVGLLAAVTVNSWIKPSMRHSLGWGCAIALIFCFVCSMGDQIHKMFVPGRYFDALDLAFDATGYIAGVIIGTSICAIVRSHQDDSSTTLKR